MSRYPLGRPTAPRGAVSACAPCDHTDPVPRACSVRPGRASLKLYGRPYTRVWIIGNPLYGSPIVWHPLHGKPTIGRPSSSASARLVGRAGLGANGLNGKSEKT
jgi:hypothetical protein